MRISYAEHPHEPVYLPDLPPAKTWAERRYLFTSWLARKYWLNDLPFRNYLEYAIRLAVAAKALAFPRRDFALQEFGIAPTNVCNAACVFCAYPQTKMAGKVMPHDVFLKALPYLGKQYEVGVCPPVGDPLVDLKLGDKVAELGKRGYRVQFTTNAILLAKHADWIFEHARHIACMYWSVPSFDPAEYREQYGVDKGEQCIQGLLDFLRRNEALGQPVTVRFQIRNRHAPRHYKRGEWFERFKPFFHGKVSYHFSHYWDNWSGAVDLKGWSAHMARRLRWSPQLARPCKQLRKCLAHPDGSMRLCGCRVVDTDQDELVVGKVGDSVAALTTNAAKVREWFYYHSRPRVCQGCSFYNPE